MQFINLFKNWVELVVKYLFQSYYLINNKMALINWCVYFPKANFRGPNTTLKYKFFLIKIKIQICIIDN